MIGDTKTPNQPELTGVFDGTAIKKRLYRIDTAFRIRKGAFDSASAAGIPEAGVSMIFTLSPTDTHTWNACFGS